MRRLRAALIAAACVAALSLASNASAAVTIGEVAPNGSVSPACTGVSRELIQPSVTAGGNLYIARQAGTIVSWSTNALPGPNQTYTVKVFRRTTDPDAFRVIGHSPAQTLDAGGGLKTFATSLQVQSGDLLGLNESGGGSNACTFAAPGDAVLSRAGSLADGSTGTFTTTVPDSRLNLSAVLVPTNTFMLGHLTRNRRKGTATLTASLSNPGMITLAGKGVKIKRASRTIFVAGPVTFTISAFGKAREKLRRRGRLPVHVTATFTPGGGDPSSQSVSLELKRKRVLRSR